MVTLPNEPGHVGILGFNHGTPTRIDNNGLPVDTTDLYAGPTRRNLDEAVGSVNGYFDNTDPGRFPISKTLPGELNTAISILQELDGE